MIWGKHARELQEELRRLRNRVEILEHRLNDDYSLPPIVTIEDLQIEFRRTHERVNCSSHWKVKESTK